MGKTENEPVDVASDDEMMDTGVLHERKGVRGQHVQKASDPDDEA